MENTDARISFVNDSTVQLRLELGTVLDARQGTDVPAGLTANSEGWIFSGGSWLGRIGGRDGEYFTPVDDFAQSPIADLFDRSDASGVLQAPADDVSKWTVLVNGSPVALDGVSRKSNILDTAETGWFTFDFRTVENVFLDLATPLNEGDVVEIRFADQDFAPVSQAYDPATTVSEAVHVNLRGFDPDDQVKVAYLSSWNGWQVDAGLADGGEGVPASYAPGTTFRVINEANGAVVKTGAIELEKSLDETTNFSLNFQGTDVWSMDLSDITQEGRYHVIVDGVGRSQSFEIAETHWGDIYGVSFSGFYHQRSGIELEAQYTDWTRPRSLHPDDGVLIQQSTVKLTDTSEGYDTSKPGFSELLPGSGTGEFLDDAWGGWHDAGDWDRRSQHLEASRKLIELAELQPEFAEARDGSIPESGDGIPDLIDEALWNLDLFRRLQKDDGGVPGGIESASNPDYGDGSWGESQEVFAYAPDVWSTWEYAATAAKAANILKTYDPAAVAGWQESAIRAMEWAEARVPVGAGYDDTLNTSRNLAAAELYRLTGDESWNDLFLQTSNYANQTLAEIEYFEHQFEAGFVYARTGLPGVDRSVVATALADLEREVRVLDTNGTGSPFGYAINPYAPHGWGNTGQQPNYSSDIFLRLHALTGDVSWLERAQADVQYTLGANPLNMAYLTGLDVARAPEEILNVDSDTLGKGPPPGITLYGDYNIADLGYQFFHGIMQDDVWPNYYQAPVTESFNGFTVFVPSTEYTVQQGITDMTFVTGYLAAENGDFGGGGNSVRQDVKVLADGRRLTVTFENGVKTEAFVEDLDNAFGWTSLLRKYDLAGNTVQSVVDYDDGRLVTRDFSSSLLTKAVYEDADDAFAWTRVEVNYEPSGDVGSSTAIFDDGRVAQNEFENGKLSSQFIEDKNDAYAWATILKTYDAAGVLIDTVITPDDVSIV